MGVTKCLAAPDRDLQLALRASADWCAQHGLHDGGFAELASRNGTIVVPVRFADNMQPDTVWTWNAIGKRRGAWGLAPDAPEATRGFLLHPLISDRDADERYVNADPITGQAAWFDLRVRITPASAETSLPQWPVLALGTACAGPLRWMGKPR